MAQPFALIAYSDDDADADDVSNQAVANEHFWLKKKKW